MRYLRTIALGLVTGALFIGSVWAGTGLGPVGGLEPGAKAPASLPVAAGDPVVVPAAGCGDLASGEACVGAAKISLEPAPPTPEEWVRDRDACTTMFTTDVPRTATHAADWRSPWIEDSNCIYMGGYGIGPMNPITSWDQQYGLWVRTAVISDAAGDTLVLTLLDAEGYFAEYNNMCGSAEPRCGTNAIAEDLAAELGIKADGFIIASTHAHTALDLIGGWGGVPDWYMDQVTTAIKDSVRQAFASRQPARIEAGESLARRYNSERRHLYWSAEDPTVNWIRGIARDNSVIATVATYATHPVNYDEELGIGHADFPVSFAYRAEANQGGGVAMVFQAGLGNMTGGGSWEPKGQGIADSIPGVGGGTVLTDTNVRFARAFWNQPVTNGPLGALGSGGFFDRPFTSPANGVAAVDTGKAARNRCRSSSPVGVRVNVVAAKIGPVVVTSAPGEIFANYSNTIEERSPVTGLAIGQANDALGYMPQSIEANPAAQQGAGFVAGSDVGYEDAYMIDRCFGDMALETTLKLLGQL